ncbi:hypothetical protein [Kitasatospora sp. GP82]|uniref:hypothetical protein n=1 Tax=Kitasatospora sp. GP82 TaxID=3035089 RepID=UPI002475C5B2|nr:hypothetical protein [Kitasatospora sp. GP82]MDH6125594.1 hypothetical protein [Kitasatospora sp. GP82]
MHQPQRLRSVARLTDHRQPVLGLQDRAQPGPDKLAALLRGSGLAAEPAADGAWEVTGVEPARIGALAAAGGWRSTNWRSSRTPWRRRSCA